MIIAPAALADARAVALVHVESWRSAYAGLLSPDYLAALSIDDRESMWAACIAARAPSLLVAKESDVVVGWISFSASRDEDATAADAEVWALYVAPTHWGRGIGRALWQRARELLVEQGHRACGLWVLAGNARAIRFYEAAGFARDSSVPKTFDLGGREVQEVHYTRRLAD